MGAEEVGWGGCASFWSWEQVAFGGREVSLKKTFLGLPSDVGLGKVVFSLSSLEPFLKKRGV